MLLCCVLCCLQTRAQDVIRVDTSMHSIEQLVRDVLISSECASISNITFSGKRAQIGFFDKGQDAVNLEEGIILSTGNSFDAAGPNDETGTSTSFLSSFHVGDIDLAQLANVNVNQVRDDAILEFDFIPIDDTMAFEFVFASEEYCDYSNSSSLYNDVFGFFLSGTDINGPFSDDAENLAISPVSNDAITVRNINHNVNFPYFIDNTPQGQVQNQAAHYTHCALDVPRDGINNLLDSDGASIEELEYDGYTTVLTARMAVTPYEEYHLKIAVADIFDNAYDSAVFLKAGSFRAGQPSASIEDADTISCTTGGEITLDATSSTIGPDMIFSWSTTDGNITLGADSPTPTVNRPGTYQLIVSKSNTACADTAIIEVHVADDYPIISDVRADTLTCTEQNVDLEIQIASPTLYTYRMRTPDGTLSSPQASPLFQSNQAGSHTLFAQSSAGCIDSFALSIEIDTAVGFFSAESIYYGCASDTFTYSPTFSEDSYDYDFQWNTSNGMISGSNLNFDVVVGSPGDYNISATSRQTGCITSYTYTVVDATAPPSIDAGEDVGMTCGNPDIEISGVINTPTSNDLISWTALHGSPIRPGSDDLHPIVSATDTYILTVTNEFGCEATDSINVLPNDQIPTLSIIQYDSVLTCQGDDAQITISIDKPILIIEWSSVTGSSFTLSDDMLSLRTNIAGEYDVKVLDTEGCEVEMRFQIRDPELPDASITGDAELSCSGKAKLTPVVFDPTTQIASWWPVNTPTDMVTAPQYEVSQPGVYVLQITDLITGCINESTWEVSDIVRVIPVDIDFEDCKFDRAWLSIDAAYWPNVESLRINQQPSASLTSVLIDESDRIDIHLSNGCIQNLSLDFRNIGPLGVEIKTSEPLYIDELFTLTAQTNRDPERIVDVIWRGVENTCDNCLSFETTLNDRQRVAVTVTDDYGCESENYIWLDPQYRLDFFIPTAFSPNDDGINETLEVYTGKNVVGTKSLRVFDRWGNMVYAVSNEPPYDRPVSWNGVIEGKEALVGTYVVEVIFETARGTFHRTTQSVLLVR